MKKFNTELKEADIRRKLALSGVSKQAEYQEIVENLETQKVRLE